MLEVLGAGTVTIIDGSKISYNTISEVHESEPFSVMGIQVNILSSGVRYNIFKREQLAIVGNYSQL